MDVEIEVSASSPQQRLTGRTLASTPLGYHTTAMIRSSHLLTQSSGSRTLRFSIFLAVVFLAVSTGSHSTAAEVSPPKGFTALFNAKDLDGWHGQPHFDPRKLAAMSPLKRDVQLAAWTIESKKHWRVEDGELVNDGLGPYLTTDREFGDLIQIVCALALDADQIQGEGRFVNALSSALKRKTRRRLRKMLGGVSIESIAGIDFRAWRSAVRAMAHSVAIDETRIEFGDVLVSLASQSTDGSTRDVTPGADLARLIEQSREAGALLRRAIGTWLSRF